MKIHLSILVILSLALVITANISCSRQDELSKIHAGDFSIVCRDKYHGRLRFLGEGREYRELVDDLRVYIEKNMSVLNLISDRFYVTGYQDYRFKFAAVDEPGYYENSGYSNSADPWKEERFD